MRWENTSVGYIYRMWLVHEDADYRWRWINCLTYYYHKGLLPKLDSSPYNKDLMKQL